MDKNFYPDQLTEEGFFTVEYREVGVDKNGDVGALFAIYSHHTGKGRDTHDATIEGLARRTRDDGSFLFYTLNELDRLETEGAQNPLDALLCNNPHVLVQAQEALQDVVEGLEDGLQDYRPRPINQSVQNRVINQPDYPRNNRVVRFTGAKKVLVYRI